MKLRIFFILFLGLGFFLGTDAEAMSKVFVRKQQEGPLPIGVETLLYQDTKRDRPVLVEVWYPTNAKAALDTPPDPVWIHPQEIRKAPIAPSKSKYPLILMSHGHMGERRDRSWLAEKLVPHGYVVASVEHHGNTWSGYNPLVSLRFWERARDVHFVLDRVLEDPFLRDSIDANRIGFIGYSLGGMTGLSLGGAKAENVKEVIYLQQQKYRELAPELVEQVDFSEAGSDFRDSRIKAMVLLCPAAFVHPPHTLERIKLPIAVVAAEKDHVLPHREHAERIIRHVKPVKVKVLKKEVGHHTLLNRPSNLGKQVLHEAICRDHEACDRGKVHEEVGDFTVSFFNEIFRR
ncbi:MAG: hypothetical protein A3E80_06755 [Chlamydiae bacterium RIFCSPHIGHO2_12_FULL_49_9]|nr:MAG: hypothetical protein A3E80_06755 [Chlamydiae bacterium RIFCSPHIGHO2_12_FULL_49_9]